MKNFRRLIVVGLLLIMVVSVAVFAITNIKMNRETEDDIEQVANTYIEGIAAEELLHFNSLAEIRFNQIDYIRNGMQKMGNLDDVDKVYENLQFFGELQELPILALVDADGNYETVYGTAEATLEKVDNIEFLLDKLTAEGDNNRAVNAGFTATTGADSEANQLILWCLPVEYPMRSGETSVGIICSRTMDSFIDKMNLDADGTLAFFHLIRGDGTYVTTRSKDAVGNTFFEKVETYATGVHRPTEEIVSDFKAAIAKREKCSWVVEYNDEEGGVTGRRSTLAFPLPDSDWYIVAILPYNELDAMIEDMSETRERAMYISISVIAATIILVFAVYLKMSQNQIKALEAARLHAEESKDEAAQARERADLLAKRNEAAVQVLHRSLKSGMWQMRFDENGKLSACIWSDKFRQMLGYRNQEEFPDELASWENLLHPDDHDRVIQSFYDTVNDYTDEKTYDVEYRVLTKNDGYHWFHAAGRLTRRTDGTPEEYFGVFIDISARIEAEERLKKALKDAEIASKAATRAKEDAELAREDAIAANKAKSEFLSNMSHDIRTPMNAIVGMTAIATDHIDDKERVRDCLKKISLSGKQLLGLINDVLDMSKIESGKMTLNPEALSLKQTMETMCDIVRPQIKANGQQFDIYINDILSEDVYCDSVRLNQVLLNFLSNAMKFTPEGGSISLDLRQEVSPKGPQYVRTHLYVSDTGMGMSEEFKKKLFTAFEREDNRRVHKTQGTGLGLTITKYIIDAMGGSIDVESTAGEGTTFHVTVDLEKVETPGGEMKLPAWRVLVVDDSEELCRSAALSLSELGTQPDTCLCGEDAVEMVIRAEKEQNGYFAILVDYKMDGMSGVETAKAIREKVGDHVPISLISAYDWADIEEEAKKAGISGFIPKPLFKSTLYHELRKYAHEENENGTAVAAAEEVDLTGIRILLAEDNDINAEIATVILEESGCIIERAEDGKIAKEMFECSEPGYFDVILMDLRMPHMNGFEATEAIRAMKRADAAEVPIIAMTADAFAEDARKCLAAGMNAHLAKPIDIDQLKETLADFVIKRKGDAK